MPKKIKNDARVNMRIPEALLEWAKVYAIEQETTVTQLFIDHLNDIKKREDAKEPEPRFY